MSTMSDFDFSPSLGPVLNTGVIRQFVEDFCVVEHISFSPSGAGDHLYLYIEKRGCNTDWVASQLASIAGLKLVDIGYAGKKDRHAVTQQWFSLHMPNQEEPDWESLPPEIRILSKTRHEKKLKSGAILSNKFRLVIRSLTGDLSEIERRLLLLQKQGIPNYFGAQRFGNNNGNVRKLIDMVKNRRRVKKSQRSMYISAGRSYLFNKILDYRVQQNNWNKAIAGDVMMLEGSHAIFSTETVDEQIERRIAEKDINPATLLWGRGERLSTGEARSIEDGVLDENPDIVDALERVGSQLAHRSLRVNIPSLKWEFQTDSLTISFDLPSGSYATSVLSECIQVTDAHAL